MPERLETTKAVERATGIEHLDDAGTEVVSSTVSILILCSTTRCYAALSLVATVRHGG